jgi:hypothetical protein
MIRITLALAFAAVALSGTAHAAKPEPLRPPNLSIKVDDGTKSVVGGTTARYLVKIDSLEPKGTKATVRMTMPRGMTFVSADHGGKVSGTSVVWNTNLPGSRLTSLSVLGTIGSVPQGAKAIAVTACVSIPGHPRPVVCAADIDRFPIASPRGFSLLPLIGGIIALVLVSGAGVWWLTRRRASAGPDRQEGNGVVT